MKYKVYSITDNKGELYLVTNSKEKARQVWKQLAIKDSDLPYNVAIEINDNFITVIDKNGMLFSEYYLHETEVERQTNALYW